MTDKCFKKCIGKPGGTLDNSEQVCQCIYLQIIMTGYGCEVVDLWPLTWVSELSFETSGMLDIIKCKYYAVVMLTDIFLFIAEMHRYVHGSIYGCMEYCVPCLQLQTTEGKSSYMNIVLFCQRHLCKAKMYGREGVSGWGWKSICGMMTHKLLWEHLTDRFGDPVNGSNNDSGHFPFTKRIF